jgi:hypothetical protein
VAILAGLIAALALVGWIRGLHPTYHVPDALPGMTRLHDGQVDGFQRRMQAVAVQHNLDLESAVYGTGRDARVFLVLASGQAAQDTDQLFTEFLGGAVAAGATVERADETRGSIDGAGWRCVPVHAASLGASVCMWREDASVGMTLDLDPGDDPSSALLDAYRASHA